MPKKKIFSLLFSMLLAAGLTVSIQSPASANAYGCDGWISPSPAGTLCHEVIGSGRTISRETAVATPKIVGLCNWRIDFRYYRTDGSFYRVSTGPTAYSCTTRATRTYAPGTLPYYGKACAYLYSRGAYFTKQCHNITP